MALAADHDLVVTVEDGVLRGGVGSMVAEALDAADVDTPVHRLGIPSTFPRHASRGEILEDFGITPQGIAQSVEEWVAVRSDEEGAGEA